MAETKVQEGYGQSITAAYMFHFRIEELNVGVCDLKGSCQPLAVELRGLVGVLLGEIEGDFGPL